MVNKEEGGISRLLHQFSIVGNALNENETAVGHYSEGRTGAVMLE